VGAFFHKFSIVSSDETSDQIKKCWGCKNDTDLLYHRAKYGRDRGSRAGCRRKIVMFFLFLVCLSSFGMTSIVITETLWSSVIFKTIMASLHRGRFVVVHLYSTFSVYPKIFPLGANLYQIFRFLKLWSHIFKARTVKFGMTVRTWDFLPSQILFLKIA